MLAWWALRWGSVLLVCSACASNPPARSTTSSQGSGLSRAGGQGLPKELPAAIGKMMKDQPCQPRLHAPLDQHILAEGGRAGAHPFVIGVGEKLCLVGDSPNALKPTDATVPVAQSQKLVSAEFAAFDFGSVLVIHNYFDRALWYRAVIKVPNRPAQQTPVCPIEAHLASLEHWPYAVEVIAFGDFVALQPGEDAGCR